MKVIFLDFDGVITTRRTDYELDKECVEVLCKIVEHTGAKIVISSTWRILHPLSELRARLAQLGINPDDIIDITPRLLDRGEEIDAWVKENKPSNYVVLDDEIFDIIDYDCGKFIVQTNIIEGLNIEAGLKVIEILNKE